MDLDARGEDRRRGVWYKACGKSFSNVVCSVAGFGNQPTCGSSPSCESARRRPPCLLAVGSIEERGYYPKSANLNMAMAQRGWEGEGGRGGAGRLKGLTLAVESGYEVVVIRRQSTFTLQPLT